MQNQGQDSRATNLRFSRQLSVVLTLGAIGLVAVVIATSVWMSQRHNDLARENARQMVIGALAAQGEKLATIVRDYSYWTDAYDAILARDMDWIYTNIGTGAAENSTADLIIVVEPGGVSEYGWTVSSEESPENGLLTAEAINSVLGPLAEVAVGDKQTVTAFARSNGQLWLLSATHVMPWEGVPEGATDNDLPRHIFGFMVTEDMMADIGGPFLIGDLSVSEAPVAGLASLPLTMVDGTVVGFATWTPPRPGATILRQIMPPLGIALLLVTMVALLSSRHVVRSAERLERALVAAQAADRSKTEFLTNVSHELRTPMNGVIGIGQVLGNTDLAPQQRGYLDILMTSAKSQMSLIDDLMDISRIESGNLQLDMAPFDLSEALSEVIAISLPTATEKGLDLHVDLPSIASPAILGDRNAFKQICTNLIGNAVKFTETGMVSVALEQIERLDEVAFTIVVSDTGPGIEARNHELIFDRFRQIDGSTARQNGGTGLGLSITKALVEMMNGTVKLRSALGEGAVFTVGIACERAPTAQMTEAA